MPRALLLIAALAGACAEPTVTATSAPQAAPSPTPRNRGAASQAGPTQRRAELERWSEALANDWHADHEQALEAFLTAGEPAVALLYGWLAEGNEHQRDAARYALSECGLRALDGALRLLGHRDAAVRTLALEVLEDGALSWSRDERAAEVVRAILPLLDDPHRDVAEAAVSALSDGSTALRLCADEIAARLRAAELPRQSALANRLAYVAGLAGPTPGAPSVGPLLRLLDADDEDLQEEARDALRLLRPGDPSHVESLLRHVNEGLVTVRIDVLLILEFWEEDAAPAADALRALARNPDEDEKLRAVALHALRGMPSQADRALADVLALLGDDDLGVEASDTLAAWSVPVLQRIPGLVAEMHGASVEQRVTILRALRHVRWWDMEPTPELIPLDALRRWLGDPNADLRHAAVKTIAEVHFRDEVAASRELVASFADTDDAVRLLAANTYVNYLHYDLGLVAEPLRPLLRDRSPAIRIIAAAGLGDVARLAAGLAADDAWVRDRAARGLIDLGKPAREAGPAVAAWLVRTREDKEREQAVQVLEAIGAVEEGVVAALAQVLRDESASSVHGDVARLLERRGADGAAAAPALASRLPCDPAVRALAAMGSAAAQAPVLDVLERLLLSGEEKAAEHALRALAAMGPAAARSEPAVRAHLEATANPLVLPVLAALAIDRAAFADELLVHLLDDDSRSAVCAAFVRLGADGARGLLRACPPHDEVLLGKAAEALTALGVPGEEAVREGLGHQDTREVCVRLIGVLPLAERTARIRTALAGPTPDVRSAAAVVLEEQADTIDPTPFGPALVPRVGEGSAAALRLLGRLRPTPPGTIAAVRATLGHDRVHVRTDAAGALFRLTGETERPLEVLRRVLLLPEVFCWKRVGEYLTEMGPRAAPIAPTLNAAVLRGPTVSLLRAIGSLGEDAAPCLPALRAAIAREIGSEYGLHDHIAFAAIDAARALGPVARDALPELRKVTGGATLASLEEAGRESLEARALVAIRAIEAR